jgi:chaperonin GroES
MADIIRPLKDNLIVERTQKEELTASGIVIPGGNRDEADRAVVIATGPDVVGINVGDTLLLNWSKAAKINGEQYKVSYDDVIGVYE